VAPWRGADDWFFCELICAARCRRGLSQLEMAELLGVCVSTLSRWETGKTVPYQADVEALAEALAIDVEVLREVVIYSRAYHWRRGPRELDRTALGDGDTEELTPGQIAYRARLLRRRRGESLGGPDSCPNSLTTQDE
jgi:transcriptional regulator with XRE-family HTH domain